MGVVNINVLTHSPGHRLLIATGEGRKIAQRSNGHFSVPRSFHISRHIRRRNFGLALK